MRKHQTIQLPKKRVARKRRPMLKIEQDALVLVSAIYSVNDAMVTLTFNQPINMDALDTHAFTIHDGIYAQQILDGATYGPYESSSVQIWFDQVESYESSTCTMTATSSSGIVRASDGAEWAGVTNFELTTG